MRRPLLRQRIRIAQSDNRDVRARLIDPPIQHVTHTGTLSRYANGPADCCGRYAPAGGAGGGWQRS